MTPFYRVRIYNRRGKLKKTISPKKLLRDWDKEKYEDALSSQDKRNLPATSGSCLYIHCKNNITGLKNKYCCPNHRKAQHLIDKKIKYARQKNKIRNRKSS